MTPVQWLRVSYRVGAAVDAAAGVSMLAPWILGVSVGAPGFDPPLPYRFAMGMGAALMLGWTALLLWADRSPLERRGVLPLTAAVVAGLAANEGFAAAAGFLPAARAVPLLLVQAALAALFLATWLRAGSAARRTGGADPHPPP
jgi:hypothetical protein